MSDVGEQQLGVRDRDRFVVDVDHLGGRVDRVRHLVDGSHCGDPRPEVEELAHSLVQAMPNCSPQERPVRPHRLAHPRHHRQRLFGEGPVDPEVMGSAEVVVVHPRRVRPGLGRVRSTSRPTQFNGPCSSRPAPSMRGIFRRRRRDALPGGAPPPLTPLIRRGSPTSWAGSWVWLGVGGWSRSASGATAGGVGSGLRAGPRGTSDGGVGVLTSSSLAGAGVKAGDWAVLAPVAANTTRWVSRSLDVADALARETRPPRPALGTQTPTAAAVRRRRTSRLPRTPPHPAPRGRPPLDRPGARRPRRHRRPRPTWLTSPAQPPPLDRASSPRAPGGAAATC